MPIARNDKGEFLTLGDDGQWTPAPMATNPETGEKLIRDGASWVPLPAPERSTGERVARGVGITGSGVNESIATTLGAVPDLVGAGMHAVGLPSSAPGFYTDMARKGVNAIGTLGGLLPGAPKPENTTEKALYGAGKGLGDAASVLIPATIVANTAKAGGMASELGKALMAQPATQLAAGATGGAVGQATDSPALGLAASIATPALMGGAARLVRPIRPNVTPETQRLLDVAEANGIPLTAGQETGSRPLKLMESAFDQLPGTAGRQEAIRETQRKAFNRASLARSGTDADVATPEVLNQARARVGGVINEISNRNTLAVTPQLEARLAQIDDSLRFLPAEAAGPVRSRIEQLRGMMIRPKGGASRGAPEPVDIDIPSTALAHPAASSGEMPTIPGAAYRLMDSQLGRSIRSTSNGDLRAALSDLRGTLRQAMDDSISPADQAAWQQARRQYANLMTTAQAAGGAGEAAATGNVSPLALRTAVNQGTGRNYAFGAGDQNELARVGQAFLRPPPDSGTAGRSHMMNVLTGTGIGGGAALAGASPLTAALIGGGGVAAPWMVQRLYYTPAVQTYLKRGIPGAAGLVDHAPQLNRPLVAAILGQEANDAIPGRQRRDR